MTIRVLLVEADDAVREGLRMVLEAEADFLVVGEAADGRAALQAGARLRPDVVVMAVDLPVADGIETTRRLRRQRRVTDVPVLLISEDDGAERLVDGIRAGAYGFVRKRVRSDTLLRAVRALADGGGYLGPMVTRQFLDYVSPRLPPVGGVSQSALAALTVREREVLRMLARGLPNAAMARELVVSEATVKSHVSALLAKLGLHSRLQAGILACQAGLAGPDLLPAATEEGAGCDGS